MEIDISPGDREILFSLLDRYLPQIPVWAHGSRVKGGAKPWSDLDLVVFTDAKYKYQLSLLKEALEESNLSFAVELLEWESLSDNLKSNITASHAVIV